MGEGDFFVCNKFANQLASAQPKEDFHEGPKLILRDHDKWSTFSGWDRMKAENW